MSKNESFRIYPSSSIMDLLLRGILYAPEDEHFLRVFRAQFQPQLALCILLRECRDQSGRFPTMPEFLQFVWAPCDETCDRVVPIEDWFRIAEYLIVEFGLAPSFSNVHTCYVHELLSGRPPTLEEFFEAAQEGEADRTTQWMHEETDEYWSKKSAEVDLDRFPVREAEDQGECCICQEPIKVGQAIRTLPCNHFFHSAGECSGIEKWLEKCSACPLCKAEV
jgi:hypothetical protein